MKKIIASIAAIATVLSLSVVSFAAEPGDSNAKVNDTKTVEADKATEFEFDTGATVVAAAGAFEADKEIKIELEATPVDNAAVATVAETVSKAPGGEGVEFNTKVSITATSDGVEVQPNGDITITIVYDDASNAVAYVDDKNNVEAIALTVSDDKKTASFTVTHFSDFYLVKVADVDAFLGKSGNNDNDDNNKPTGLAIAIVPAAIAAAAVVVSKKRK